MTLTAMPKYEVYKDSGVEWLGKIPHDWTLISLNRTVVGCVNGLWGNEPNGVNDIVVLRVADFERNKLKINDQKLTVRSIPLKDRYGRLLKNGDLLIEKSGGGDKTLVGCVVLFDKTYDAITSNFVAKMTPKDNFDARFLCYLFSALYSSNVNYRSIKQTTGIQNLDSGAYLSEVAAFPLLPTQTAIANFLDTKTTQIDEAIAIKEQQIALLNERKQILIQQAVTQGLDPTVPMTDSGVTWIDKIPAHWTVLANKNIFKIRKELVGTRSNKYTLLSLTLRGVIKRDMENPEGKFPAEFNTYQEVREGDFVFCLFDVEETPRTVGLSRYNGMITGAYTVFETTRKVNNVFLYYFYLFLDQKKRLKPLYKGLRNTIPKDSFMAFKTLIPPLDEQDFIVDILTKKLEEINKIDLIIKAQIEKLKEYKTTLINSAVTGKIKVV
ncbi:restriction endonuclease subunit S [Aeromonas rivipollensis]|uniref:restriction endonuclease subunit S n=1 Tax=Aeromonas rivipollensis TaxID=948519 RepID=UPI003D254A38